MPRKHSRTLAPAPAFHMYNRGANGAAVFRSDADRDYFRDLLGRYLGGPYRGSVSVIAFCLMTTHFHLISIERSSGAIASLMHRMLAAYVIYYRRKYGGKGPLFDGPYRRKPITTQKQLRWTIAYVHDNHPSGVDYRWSSHRFYRDGEAPSWLDATTGIAAFGGREHYFSYLDKRASRKRLDREFF